MSHAPRSVCHRHTRRRPDVARSNIRALTTVNGDLSAVAFILRLAKDKAKEKVGPEFSLIFRSMSHATTSAIGSQRKVGSARHAPLEKPVVVLSIGASHVPSKFRLELGVEVEASPFAYSFEVRRSEVAADKVWGGCRL